MCVLVRLLAPELVHTIWGPAVGAERRGLRDPLLRRSRAAHWQHLRLRVLGHQPHQVVGAESALFNSAAMMACGMAIGVRYGISRRGDRLFAGVRRDFSPLHDVLGRGQAPARERARHRAASSFRPAAVAALACWALRLQPRRSWQLLERPSRPRHPARRLDMAGAFALLDSAFFARRGACYRGVSLLT